MKIIEEKPFVYRFTCKSCGSELEAEASDVEIGDFGSAAFDTTHLSPYVTCPVCDRDEMIAWSKLPPKVEAMARKKSAGKY